MPDLLRIINPLRQVAEAFFKHDVKLHRDDAGVRIVLQDKAQGGSPRQPATTAGDAAKGKQREELALIRRQLGELLDELPETRRTMRALCALEQALARKGLRALDKLPLDVLRRALDQLEGLVTNWSPVGLASLRSKMAVAIIDREHMDPEAEADAYRTSAVLDPLPEDDGLPEVVDHSDDDALAAAYAALGAVAPTKALEVQPELGSPSARAVTQTLPRPGQTQDELRLREVRV